MENNVKLSIKSVADSVKNSVSEILSNSDFLSRTIGMNNSYEDITFLVQALGRKPVSLLGKDYAFIFDHVRRNYMQGTEIPSTNFEYCNKFTFYKEVPSVKFANVEEDPMNLKDRWVADFDTSTTIAEHTEYYYAESDDNESNNINIPMESGLEYANPGISNGTIESFPYNLKTCDLIGKTNSNFKHGKYETLIARFHTNTQESKDLDDATQTAKSKTYGLSHGRNLLKLGGNEDSLGYDNPYCRVWTYHHQYNQIKRQIRPFEEATTQEMLENKESMGVGTSFRTIPSSTYDTIGGSKSLDKYGVLNYSNGTVNIAPTAKIKDYFDKGESDLDKDKIAIKKCMFSIENLAWKDDSIKKKNEFEPYGLSAEQKGPLGGRIMWFPPYNLEFNEDVSVRWNENEFIGRGEKVYTYTNTERNGNLKFTLLIDHPSILDYWSGHERNGMTNQGNTLVPGRGSGIDEIDSQENTLLRFFAGCEILTSKPQTFTYTSEKEVPKEKPSSEPQRPKVEKTICSVLYFPNNYSGIDDWNYDGYDFNPIYYLMNGVGTQYFYDEKDDNVYYLETDVRSKPLINGSTQVTGYEVGVNEHFGISLANGVLEKNKDIRESTFVKHKNGKYFTTTTKNGKNIVYHQYLTNYDGTPIEIKYQNSVGKLIKYPTVYSSKPNSKNVLSNRWLEGTFYYRIDEAYVDAKYPSHPEAYIDLNSFGLNHKNFGHIRNDKELLKRMGIEDKDTDTFRLVSFTDLFCALIGDRNKVIDANNNDNVNLIKEILLKENKKYSDIKFEFYGNASRTGYNGKKGDNADLAKNRAKTLLTWMKKSLSNLSDELSKASVKSTPNLTKNQIDSGRQSNENVKLWRCASVVIKYSENTVENAATAELPKVETEKDANGNAVPVKDAEGKVAPSTERIESDNKETSVKYSSLVRNYFDASQINSVLNSTNLYMNNSLTELLGKKGAEGMAEAINEAYGKKESEQEVIEKTSTVKRYDNEGEFFQVLSENEPFLHHLISEKIKYFDPAFHSISPEGFNARLTFLHQCTRQGSTTEKSSTGEINTAYNLSFGRPPVCVLRIGDFYYTKIIIKTLSIQYNQHNWDMNPEGIGMMPMYADININFAFLGGSDIAGPIARLQNAVSFNYYANTSVYDNRAEKVEYNPSGNGEEIRFKPFNYPNQFTKEWVDDNGTRHISSLLNRIGNKDDERSGNKGIIGEEYL